MWNNFADSGSGVRSNLGYYEEGNVKTFKFTENPHKVRFLTENVDVEQVMSERHLSREEASDYIERNMGGEKWLAPKPYWEHTVRSIPQVRFFSTVYCRGRTVCPLCADNEKDRARGVQENKMLSFPIRKRFICPVWSYDLKMVLYITASEDFFQSVAKYIAKHGSEVDFEVSKSGKGYETKYEAFFLGKSQDEVPAHTVLSPSDVDLSCSDKELARRLGKKVDEKEPPRQEEKREEPPKYETTEKQEDPAPKQELSEPKTTNAKDFVLPFGTHKGKTLAEVDAVEGREYIKFLADNSTGIVQQMAQSYLA